MAGDDDTDETIPTDGEPEARAVHRPHGTAPLPAWWWRLDLRWRRAVFAVVVVVVVGSLGLVINNLLGGDDDSSSPVVVRTEAERFVDDLPPERVELWDSVAECETEGDWTSINDPFYGGLQFTIQSWQAMGGLGRADQVPREEQIMRAEMLLEEQGWDAWPNCAAQLGLR